MANYAQSLYGNALYGPSTTAADLVTNFTSTVLDYGSIHLSWSNPASQWIRMRLVRSQYGFPMTQDDGVVLFDVNAGPAATAPLDAALRDYTDQMLTTPRFYYYSIFVSKLIGNSIQWVRSGIIIGQSVKDHGYTNYLLSRLPSVFTADSGSAINEVPDSDNSTAISRFFSILATDLSRARDFYDHLTASWDPERLHVNLLPELLGTYNYSFEPMVGIRNNRAYAASAPYISQMKGTAAAAVTMGEAITGFGIRVLPFVNLMLDENDASFEQSIGHWAVNTGAATLTWVSTPTINDGTNSAAGAMQVTATAGGSIDLAPGNSGYGFGSNNYGDGQYGVGVASTAIKAGIPVTTGKPYVISGYVWAAGNTTQPIFDLQWFDATGAFLSTTTGVAGPTAGANYTARPSTSDSPPSGAAYVIPHLRLVGVTNGDIFYIDHVQFEQASIASTYAPARQIVLRMVAPRVNEFLNPGFDVSVNDWSTSNSTIAWDSTTTYNGGSGACKVTPTANGNASVSSQVPVDPLLPYVYAAQIFSATTQTYTMQVQWIDASNNVSGSSAVLGLTVPANTWTRLALVGDVVPSNAVQARANILAVPGSSATAAVFWVDDCLFEEINRYGGAGYGSGAFGDGTYGGVTGYPNLIGDTPYGAGLYGGGIWGGVNPPRYFDTRTDPVDVKLDGAQDAGRFHLYPLFAIRESRLKDLLSQTVPLGAYSNVVWALPGAA